MKSFATFISESVSNAAKQAKKLGLKGDGHGSWVDPNGRIVGRTIEGELVFNSPPDHDNPTDSIGNNIYALTVNATDLAGNTSRQRLWIYITKADTVKPTIYGVNGVTTPSSVLCMSENETYINTFVADE